jgi:hypothetical protein
VSPALAVRLGGAADQDSLSLATWRRAAFHSAASSTVLGYLPTRSVNSARGLAPNSPFVRFPSRQIARCSSSDSRGTKGGNLGLLDLGDFIFSFF